MSLEVGKRSTAALARYLFSSLVNNNYTVGVPLRHGLSRSTWRLLTRNIHSLMLSRERVKKMILSKYATQLETEKPRFCQVIQHRKQIKICLLCHCCVVVSMHGIALSISRVELNIQRYVYVFFLLNKSMTKGYLSFFVSLIQTIRSRGGLSPTWSRSYSGLSINTQQFYTTSCKDHLSVQQKLNGGVFSLISHWELTFILFTTISSHSPMCMLQKCQNPKAFVKSTHAIIVPFCSEFEAFKLEGYRNNLQLLPYSW